MMRALYQMAKALGGKSDSALAEIVDPVESGTLVISLNLKTKADGSVVLTDHRRPFELSEEAATAKKAVYALKRKGSQGANYTPTAQLTDPEITFNMRLLGFFRNYGGDNISILAVKEFLADEKRAAELRQNLSAFVTQVTSKPAEAKGKKTRQPKVGLLLTVKIDGQYPGERSEYQALLEEAATNALGEGRSEGISQCSITLEPDVPVYGRAGSHFPFYTIDKPGMIVGGFREENAWKNFPVSQVGGQALKQAREYLDAQQKFYMPGNFKYWVIPKFVFSDNQSMLREMLDSLEALSKRSPGFGLGNEAAREYVNMEEDLKLLSKEIFDRVLMTFLFYEKPQKSQLVIKLAIDDVPPSRLRQLVLSQKQVSKLQTYSDWIQTAFPPPKDEKSTFGLPIRFSFGLVWQFYKREAQKAGEAKYDADYLQFIRQLYLDMPPDPRRILRVIVETLQALFKNPDLGLPIFDYRALEGLCWVRYLCELNLWQPYTSKKGVEMKLETLSIEPDFKKRNENGEFADPWMASLEKFLKEHPELARSSFLCGAFLLGCLVRLLLDIQSRNLPGTPFEKELKGLRLKREDIPLLFSKTIAKLRDYDSDNFPNIRVLDQLVSDLCLRERVEDVKLSHDEVSAYFAFGLAQGRVFKTLAKPPKKESKNPNAKE